MLTLDQRRTGWEDGGPVVPAEDTRVDPAVESLKEATRSSRKARELDARQTYSVTRGLYAAVFFSLILGVLAIILSLVGSNETAGGVATSTTLDVLSDDAAVQDASRNAEQDKAIEALAQENSKRKERGLPPVRLPLDIEDSLVQATVLRVLAEISSQDNTAVLSSADVARIAGQAADIAQGRIIVPTPAEIVPCLSEPGGCKGEPGQNGQPGQIGEAGQEGQTGAQGPAGTQIIGLDTAEVDGRCLLVLDLRDPSDGSTSQATTQIADEVCGSIPVLEPGPDETPPPTDEGGLLGP